MIPLLNVRVNAYPAKLDDSGAVKHPPRIQVLLYLSGETGGSVDFYLSPGNAAWLSAQLLAAAQRADSTPPEAAEAANEGT